MPLESRDRSRILVNNNGRIQPAEEAVIPAMDHGFLYGDSVYETLRTYRGRPFLLERHLDRLWRSLDRISLSPPCGRSELRDQLRGTFEAYHEPDAGEPADLACRLVVTRGVGPIGLDVTLCVEPRFLIFAFAVRPLPESYLREGIAAVVSGVRRNHPSALDPGIKSGNFLNNILAFHDARDAGAQEAFLLSADGYVAEGTTSNIFVVERGLVRTPGAFGILDGITRAVVLEECRREGIPIEESRISAEQLLGVEEAFITSSVRGIVPVTRINGQVVGDGAVGLRTREILGLYDARIERECGD